MDRINIVKPGLFSKMVSADGRRSEFDCKNEIVVTNKVPVDFVFIGDSITHNWELNAYFGRSDRLILNRGIAGDTTEYVLKRFEADVLQLHPKHCIVKIGVNDTWALESDPWSGKQGESAKVVEGQIIKNITGIMDLAMQHMLSLAICSILPTNMDFSRKTRERNILIHDINQLLKELCHKKNMIYVDYHSHMLQDDEFTIMDGLTVEGLHPHVLGYNIMAEVLRKTLFEYMIEI